MEMIAVTRRGGDVPDGGDVTAAGLPVTTMPSLAKNAWLLWKRALTEARKNQYPAVKNGVAGWEWNGVLGVLEQELWPGMIPASHNPAARPVASVRTTLRRYLREAGNIVVAGDDIRGNGRYGTNWFIRAEYDDAVPALWLRGDDSAAARRGDVSVSWRCPDCQQPFAGRILLNEHRVAEHPVTAPELPGESILGDILTCLGEDQRMHISDLATLLYAGNPAAYGHLTVTGLSRLLRDQHRVFPKQMVVGAGSHIVRAGIFREWVEDALHHADDVEAALTVARARAVAEAQAAAADPATLIRQGLDAIITEMKVLRAEVTALRAERDQLASQPVSQELIDKALESITGPLKAERDTYKRQLDAARKVIGLG